LEGDQTPLDAVTDIDDESVAGVSHGLEHNDQSNGHDDDYGSGSDSSNEHSGHEADIEPDQAWRSPLPAPGALNPSQSIADQRHFLPPVSHTPPGTNSANSATALPGLPAPLPGSRRWYSGTNSSENVNNIFGVSPSNDSLLMSGYEASPFAPTSLEKQQLASKWGALSKRWARNDPATSSTSLGTGQPVHPGTTRSISDHMSTGWASPRLVRMDLKEDQGQSLLPPDLGQGQNAGGLGGQGEKKPFRFFSLRRPTSSGSANDRSGTSPARE
jgi:hypothetical protein